MRFIYIVSKSYRKNGIYMLIRPVERARLARDVPIAPFTRSALGIRQDRQDRKA
jgi:hypothetical protein